MKNKFLKTTIILGTLIPTLFTTTGVVSCAKTENFDDFTKSFLEKNASREKLYEYMEENSFSNTISGLHFNMNDPFDKKILENFIVDALDIEYKKIDNLINKIYLNKKLIIDKITIFVFINSWNDLDFSIRLLDTKSDDYFNKTFVDLKFKLNLNDFNFSERWKLHWNDYSWKSDATEINMNINAFFLNTQFDSSVINLFNEKVEEGKNGSGINIATKEIRDIFNKPDNDGEYFRSDMYYKMTYEGGNNPGYENKHIYDLYVYYPNEIEGSTDNWVHPFKPLRVYVDKV